MLFFACSSEVSDRVNEEGDNQLKSALLSVDAAYHNFKKTRDPISLLAEISQIQAAAKKNSTAHVYDPSEIEEGNNLLMIMADELYEGIFDFNGFFLNSRMFIENSPISERLYLEYIYNMVLRVVKEDNEIEHLQISYYGKFHADYDLVKKIEQDGSISDERKIELAAVISFLNFISESYDWDREVDLKAYGVCEHRRRVNMDNLWGMENTLGALALLGGLQSKLVGAALSAVGLGFSMSGYYKKKEAEIEKAYLKCKGLEISTADNRFDGSTITYSSEESCYVLNLRFEQKGKQQNVEAIVERVSDTLFTLTFSANEVLLIEAEHISPFSYKFIRFINLNEDGSIDYSIQQNDKLSLFNF